MALEEVANEVATVSVSNGATGIINSPGSLKTKINGLGVLKGTINIVLAGGVSGTCTGVAGTGTITATATKTKADGSPVLRKGDTGSGTIAGTDSATSGGPCSFDVDIEIDNAGQIKVKAQ